MVFERRLEDRPEPDAGVPAAQTGKSFADGGGMVAEVVDDGDVAHDATDFWRRLMPLKSLQGLLNLRDGHVVEVRGGGRPWRRCRILEVADEGGLRRCSRTIQTRKYPSARRGLPMWLPALAEKPTSTMGAGHFLASIDSIRIVGIEEDHAFAGDDVEQTAEGGLDLVEIRVNVGMIELDVVHDHQLALCRIAPQLHRPM